MPDLSAASAGASAASADLSAASADPSAASALDLLHGRPLVVLTGAGVSTDSGIPDYRGPRLEGTAPTAPPMTYQEFIASATNQQRYWARAHLGWSRMHQAEPNPGHRALALLDPTLLITQNVDGLHERAGSRQLVALHGRISEVICLDCREISDRAALNERMSVENPGWIERHDQVRARPDGDVELEDTRDFRTPACLTCGGRLKPHVVFFGENVPKHRVERSYAAVESLADTDGALLVAGSSLSVMSGLRFVRRAHGLGVPVVIVNRGETRGDELATYTLNQGCSEFLTDLADLSAVSA